MRSREDDEVTQLKPRIVATGVGQSDHQACRLPVRARGSVSVQPRPEKRGGREMSNYRSLSISLGSVLILVTVWWAVGVLGIVNPNMLPTPHDMVSTFETLWSEGYSGKTFYEHVMASLLRAFSGFFAAIIVGVPLGLLIGSSAFAAAALAPIFSFLRPIPAIAFVPLVVLYFGIGETSKIVLVFATAMLYLILSVSEGVRSIPQNLMRVAQNMGLSSWQRFISVIYPGSLGHIFLGIRTAAAISWALVVAAELVAAQEGIGYIIMDAATFFRIDYVYAGVAIIGVIGLLLERTVAVLQHHIVHWTGK